MNYRYKKLKNGMKLLAVQTSEFKSVYGLMLTLGGSYFEPAKKLGISHFVEHMVLEGSEKFPDSDQFDEIIDILGASYNAYTSPYTIGIRGWVPDSSLTLLLDFLESSAFAPTFPETKLESERKAIKDEIHNRISSPDYKFNLFYDKNRFEPDGIPPKVIGTLANVKKMSRKELMAWREKVFAPSNMAIMLFGNVKPDRTIRELEKRFSGYVTQPGAPDIKNPFMPKLAKSRVAVQVDGENKQSIGIVSFRSTSRLNSDLKERIVYSLLASIIANNNTSILYRKLRRDMGLIYNVSINKYLDLYTDGVFDIEFTTSDENICEVFNVIYREIEQLQKSGVTEKQLSVAIERGNNALKMGYSSLGDVVEWYASDIFWYDRIDTVEEIIQLRSSITLEYVNDILKRILDPECTSVIARINSKSYKKGIESDARTFINNLSAHVQTHAA